MKKNSVWIIGVLFVVVAIWSSGCLEQFFSLYKGDIKYEQSAAHVRYTIQYGYRVNCSGEGTYEINYKCDDPEVLNGSAVWIPLYDLDYKNISLVNNTFIQWVLAGRKTQQYVLGVKADVESHSFLVHDLSGSKALSIRDIEMLHPEVVQQYCHSQIAQNVTYISAERNEINWIVEEIRNQVDGNNSFVVAKSLFLWLMNHTTYQPHLSLASEETQPAMKTLNLATGDCDDLTFLYISLCRSAGIPARFIRGYLVDNLTGVPKAVAHMWAEVFVGGNIGNNGWIPVECACLSDDSEVQIHQNFGVEDAGYLRVFVDDGSHESMNLIVSGVLTIASSGMQVDAAPFVTTEAYQVVESRNLMVNPSGYRNYE